MRDGSFGCAHLAGLGQSAALCSLLTAAYSLVPCSNADWSCRVATGSTRPPGAMAACGVAHVCGGCCRLWLHCSIAEGQHLVDAGATHLRHCRLQRSVLLASSGGLLGPTAAQKVGGLLCNRVPGSWLAATLPASCAALLQTRPCWLSQHEHAGRHGCAGRRLSASLLSARQLPAHNTPAPFCHCPVRIA